MERRFSLTVEALEVIAADLDRDGRDELLIIGEREVVAATAQGRELFRVPIPTELSPSVGFATGYYDAMAGDLVFRTSTRLAGARLSIATKQLGWDAEPNLPMCHEIGASPTVDPAIARYQGAEVRRIRCGDLWVGHRRLAWRGTLLPTQRLTGTLAWCGESACDAAWAWPGVPDRGDAFAVWPVPEATSNPNGGKGRGANTGGAVRLVTSSSAPRGEGDELVVWALDGLGARSARAPRRVWSAPVVAGIIGIVAMTTAGTGGAVDTPTRLFFATRFVGAGRLDLWEVVW